MARPRAQRDYECAACGAPVHRQWVGRVAALRVTADMVALTADEQQAARTPNRLIWCYRRASDHTPADLRSIGPLHPADCPHPHVAEHHCNPEPTTLF